MTLWMVYILKGERLNFYLSHLNKLVDKMLGGIYRRKKFLLGLFLTAIVVCVIAFRTKLKSSTSPLNEKGGIIPFVRVQYIQNRNGKPPFLLKKPFEACVEMVMYYWGSPPTEVESRSLLSPPFQEWTNSYKILKRHRLSFLWVVGLDLGIVKKILQLRIPIIAACNVGSYRSVELSYICYFVLKDFKNGRFVFNDPLTKENLEMDAELFMNAYWLNYDTNAFLIFPPSKKNELKKVLPDSCIKEDKELDKIKPKGEKYYTEKLVQRLRKKLEKGIPTAYFADMLGYYLSREGDEGGLFWLWKAYEMSKQPFYFAEYAIAHCYIVRNEEAKKLLEKLIRDNPKFIAVPSVFFHLCYLLSREGKEEGIRKLFQKASAIAPPHLLTSLIEAYHFTLPTPKEKIRLLKEFFAKYPWAKRLKAMDTLMLFDLLGEKKWKEAEEFLHTSEAEGLTVPKEWFKYIEALRDAYQGRNEKAEKLYLELKSLRDLTETWSFMKIDLLEAMGNKDEARKETLKLVKRFTPKGWERYEERKYLNISKLYALCRYIDLSISSKDYKGALWAIEDFLKLHKKMVVLGYDRFACYAQAMGGMIYYWEGNRKNAKELLIKACRNPYFKKLGQLARDAEKVLKELSIESQPKTSRLEIERYNSENTQRRREKAAVSGFNLLLSFPPIAI
jgi:tetratricopeptide (TPR) repeat protein